MPYKAVAHARARGKTIILTGRTHNRSRPAHKARPDAADKGGVCSRERQ